MKHQLDQLLLPGSADDVWNRFLLIAAEMGYPYIHYATRRFATLPHTRPVTEPEWRSNFPAAVLRDLTDGSALLSGSPWGRWSRDHMGFIPLEQINSPPAGAWPDREIDRLINRMRQHQVLAGHCVSMLGVSADNWGLVLLSTGPGTDQRHADALWQKLGQRLAIFCKIMHLRICALPASAGPEILTPRQREVVEWAAHGKTVSEIAQILGVEVTTVEKHLRLARGALGATTTAQAILQAYQRRQIFVQTEAESNAG